jgi:hypothetical protein
VCVVMVVVVGGVPTGRDPAPPLPLPPGQVSRNVADSRNVAILEISQKSSEKPHRRLTLTSSINSLSSRTVLNCTFISQYCTPNLTRFMGSKERSQ